MTPLDAIRSRSLRRHIPLDHALVRDALRLACRQAAAEDRRLRPGTERRLDRAGDCDIIAEASA